jgi:hypothetical protein
MSARQLLRAAAALAVLIVVWGAVEIVRRLGVDREVPFTLPALTAPDVDSVVMAKGEDTTRLVQRDGARWEVNGYPASSAEVTKFFDAVRDTARSNLVARSATSHERLGVDSAAGRRVRFVGGGRTLADLVFGERGREWGTIYVRPATESEVYLLGGQLGNLIDRNADAWRDPRIAALDPDGVTEIDVQRGESEYTLVRGDSAWSVDGALADSGVVAQLLQELRDVSGSGFPSAAQADSADFAAPDRRLEVRGAGGRILLALAFDSISFAYWVRHDSGGQIFRLDGWRADRLVPADSAVRGQ